MKKNIFYIFITTVLISCSSSSEKEKIDKFAPRHDDVEYRKLDDNEEILDFKEKNNDKVEVPKIPNEESKLTNEVNPDNTSNNTNYNTTPVIEKKSRLEELKDDPEYQRANGKIKIGKIKRELRREGLKNEDGENFKRKDVY